jgi:hypothetical protein
MCNVKMDTNLEFCGRSRRKKKEEEEAREVISMIIDNAPLWAELVTR